MKILKKNRNYNQNKAIFRALSINNMNIKSAYQFPQFVHFQSFLSVITQENNRQSNLIRVSLFLGFQLSDLLQALFNTHKTLKYNDTGVFYDEVPQNIYASKAYAKGNITISMHIPTSIQNMLLPLFQEYRKIKKDSTDYEVQTFISNEIKDCMKFFNTCKKNFNKHIDLTLHRVSKLMQYYFHQFHEESDISILYIPNASQDQTTKTTYVSGPSRLFMLELWVNEFYQLCTDKISNTMPLSTSFIHNIVGSPFFVKDTEFKMFFEDLDTLYQLILHQKRDDKDIIILNLQMILIRYGLAILIATRNNKLSCNLYNYSFNESFLTIHEKARTQSSSKRLIPLTHMAQAFIELFYQIKRRYNIIAYHPILFINGQEIECSKNNIVNFFQSVVNENIANKLVSFIENTEQNAGRHIYSTLARRTNIKMEYEDAFLNHFFLANVDQASWSNFDNPIYFDEIVNYIQNEIEPYYFPSTLYLLKG